MPGITIRSELPQDQAAIRALHALAFGGDLEARIVDRLRDARAADISLVAVDAGAIIGHVLLSPVEFEQARERASSLGLAPIGVTPAQQRKGVGAALMHRAIELAREGGIAAIVLVGEPEYYKRFGFVPAMRFGLRCKWPGTEEAFMALELEEGALRECKGLVSYHEAFDIAA